MGIRGKLGTRIELIPPLEPIKKIRKRKDDSDYHTRLCRLSAKFLKAQSGVGSIPRMNYVTVELCTLNEESADVFAWCSWTSVLIEVKISRSDFNRDFKKPFRTNPKDGLGEYRYYCCPEGIIQVEDLPDNWGLLWEKDNEIILVKNANRQQASLFAERAIMTSIMRREGVKSKIYDYKEQRQVI